MTGIIVQGSAEAQLPPTEARVTVTVNARAPEQPKAVERCAGQCDAVDHLIEQERDRLVRTAVTTSVRVVPEWETTTERDRRLRGYLASRQTVLTCAPDGDGLTRLLSALATVKYVLLSGPQWRIEPGAPGWDDLRSAAAADCRRRAEAYAEGLGVTVGRVVWIAEPGLRAAADSANARPLARAAIQEVAARSVDGESPRVIRVTPEPMTINTSVEAQFDLG